MVNPITRFKEWRAYKRALKDMEKIIELQKEIPTNEDGSISGDNKKLFDANALNFTLSTITVMRYRLKYFK